MAYSFYGVTDTMAAPHNSKNPCLHGLAMILLSYKKDD